MCNVGLLYALEIYVLTLLEPQGTLKVNILLESVLGSNKDVNKSLQMINGGCIENK